MSSCGDRVEKTSSNQGGKRATRGDAAAPDIILHSIDKPGFDALLAHLPGKVILVDFWATWCPPCREKFPHSVELSRKFGPQGLEVITLACDDEKATADVLTFLRAHEAVLQNLRSASGAGEKTFEDFEIDGGALPHYKLYDRSGKLRRTFSTDPVAQVQFSLADVDAAVIELLAEKPGDAATVADEPDEDEHDEAESRERE